MASYSNVTVSNYNQTPPPDDGSQTSANKAKWSDVKTKLGDPLKTAIEAIDTNVDTAFTALGTAADVDTGTASGDVALLQTGGKFATATLPSGTIVQMQTAIDTASATTTTTMPSDDTIPQSAEGGEFITVAITPTSASNTLIIEANVQLSCTTAADITVALFQDSTGDALAAVARFQSGGASYQNSLTHIMTAGTTSSTTFKIRAGMDIAGTTRLNGYAGARIYGGVCASTLTVKELKA